VDKDDQGVLLQVSRGRRPLFSCSLSLGLLRPLFSSFPQENSLSNAVSLLLVSFAGLHSSRGGPSDTLP